MAAERKPILSRRDLIMVGTLAVVKSAGLIDRKSITPALATTRLEGGGICVPLDDMIVEDIGRDKNNKIVRAVYIDNRNRILKALVPGTKDNGCYENLGVVRNIKDPSAILQMDDNTFLVSGITQEGRVGLAVYSSAHQESTKIPLPFSSKAYKIEQLIALGLGTPTIVTLLVPTNPKNPATRLGMFDSQLNKFFPTEGKVDYLANIDSIDPEGDRYLVVTGPRIENGKYIRDEKALIDPLRNRIINVRPA